MASWLNSKWTTLRPCYLHIYECYTGGYNWIILNEFASNNTEHFVYTTRNVLLVLTLRTTAKSVTILVRDESPMPTLCYLVLWGLNLLTINSYIRISVQYRPTSHIWDTTVLSRSAAPPMRNLCFVTIMSWLLVGCMQHYYVLELYSVQILFSQTILSYLNNVDKALKDQNSFKFIIIIDFWILIR